MSTPNDGQTRTGHPRFAAQTASGEQLSFSARLAVGADGRNSTVRRQIGIDLDRHEAIHMVAGVIVDGLEVEMEHDFLASTDELFMASFRQHDGQMRVYLCPGIAQKNRFAGPTGMAEFLRDALRTGDFSTASFRAYADERLERMRRLRNASMVMVAAMTDDCDNRMARRAKFFELQETEPLMLAMMIGLFGGPENAPPEAFDGHLRELIQAA